MQKLKFRNRGRRILALLLAAAMTVTMLPQGGVKAADTDTTPYVVSYGRSVSASSNNGDNTAEKAVDNDLGTRWESEHGVDPQWFEVDLGKVTDITSIYIKWEGAYATTYKIQFSDDEETWNDKYSTSACKGGEENLNIAGSARYVRIYMTKRATGYGCSFFEFQVYGLNGMTKRPVNYGTNLALNKPVTASKLRDEWWMYDAEGNIKPDSLASVQASNAVDGKDNTSFTSYQADNQWIYVDLERSYTIGRVTVDWTADAGKIYDIQVSTDAQNWKTIYRRLNGYPELKDNIVVYEQNVKYVRMYGYTKAELGSGFGIKELAVYEYNEGDPKTTYTISQLPQSEIVRLGSGSYLSNDMYLEKTKLPAYIDEEKVKAPIASNDWWQSAMIKRFGNMMCVTPLKAKFSARGLNVLTMTNGWLPDMGETDVNVSVISESQTDIYVSPENLETSTSYDRVSGYSDYSVTLDLCDDNGVQMQSTFVKGSPYIFNEFGNTEVAYISSDNFTGYFDDAGKDLFATSSTVTADHIGVEVTDNDNKAKTKTAKSYYCITVPQGTQFKLSGTKIKVTFPAKNGYMSVGTMNSKAELNAFYQHGYAFVTNTKVTYTYDENTANIVSNYNVTTTVKRTGFSNQTMQCMFPHQWKRSSSAKDKVAVYKSVRGNMYAIFANQFSTSDTFAGMLPTFAMPTDSSMDTAKLMDYLNTLDAATSKLTPAGDAYWEGKNLHPLGMGVLMADQLGETEMRDVFLSRIKKILINWFNYDGPDDISFLIYNQNWGTIYYEHSEFGANAAICDHHFTYGYFVFAATVLATYDKEFYTDYKDMIELLIRDYANPDDDDDMFCRFRAYDRYSGHSWAGGYADNDSGNNQESASESLFSWASLYLWGALTENDKYRDAGVFGFTNEMEAVKQYWFDYDKDNWIADWPYEVVGQVYGGINFYGTFFGGQPLYIYGIQWLPISEYLTYYGMNQERCAEIYQALLDDTEIAKEKAYKAAIKNGKSVEEAQKEFDNYTSADTGWQHITWPFLSQTNPTLALEKFNANAKTLQTTDQANTYWFINSMLQYGYKTLDVVATGEPSSSVYYNEDTKKYTANVWNPTESSKTVTFKNKSGATVGTATVGAKALVSFEVKMSGGFNYTQVETPTFKTTGLADGKVKTNVSGEVVCDDTQLVEIGCKDTAAKIYYTTDGSVPTTSSKQYEGKILVSSTTTIKAIAVRDGYINSTFASLSLNINGDSVESSQNLALGKKVEVSSSENDGSVGSYAVDGNKGTRWSSKANNDNEWFVLDLGSVQAINTIKITWEAACAKEYEIQVSTDGDNWTTVSTITNGAPGERTISFNAVKAQYVKMQGISRATAYGYSIYEFEVYGAIQAQAPTINPMSGTYASAQKVTLSTAVKGAEIKYTIDGTTPTEDSPTYVEPFTVNKSTVVKAVTYRKGMLLSNVTVSTIIISGTIALSENNMVVAVGNAKQLAAYTDGAVTWTSSNQSIATVDTNGRVTGVKVGTATITAKTGNNTATCVVEVKTPVKLQSIILPSDTMTMTVKTSATLNVTFNPSDTTDDTTLTWESSNDSIVSVLDGTLTAKKEGMAVVTVRCGNLKAECAVTVQPKYTVEQRLKMEEYNVLLKDGVKLYQSGCFEGSLANLIDGTGFGTSAGGNWASQTINAGDSNGFIIIDLDKEYSLAEIENMYIQWKNFDQTLPTDGFKIMVANDDNFNITVGKGKKQSNNEDIDIVTNDSSSWTTVFDSAVDNATNAEGGYDWAANSVGCLSILPINDVESVTTFNHIKIQFVYSKSTKNWGVQAYEMALLMKESVEEETTTPQQTTPQQTTPQQTTPQQTTPQQTTPQQTTPQQTTPQQTTPQQTTPQQTTPQQTTPQQTTPQQTTPQQTTPQQTTPQQTTPQQTTPEATSPQESTSETTSDETGTTKIEVTTHVGPTKQQPTTKTQVTTNKTTNKTTTKAAVPGKTKVKKAQNVKKRKIKVTLSKVKNVTGYQVQYSTNKKFKKGKKITKTVTSKKISITLKKLKAKKYYVRARAYKLTNGKKVYGKWCKIKTVKVKK